MYAESNYELYDVPTFINFAKEFIGKEFEICQFSRINDTTVSWQSQRYRIRTTTAVSPNVFITVDFDNEDKTWFVLEVKFHGETRFRRNFESPVDAVKYLNNSVETIQTKKNCLDTIWAEYGL